MAQVPVELFYFCVMVIQPKIENYFKFFEIVIKNSFIAFSSYT